MLRATSKPPAPPLSWLHLAAGTPSRPGLLSSSQEGRKPPPLRSSKEQQKRAGREQVPAASGGAGSFEAPSPSALDHQRTQLAVQPDKPESKPLSPHPLLSTGLPFAALALAV